MATVHADSARRKPPPSDLGGILAALRAASRDRRPGGDIRVTVEVNGKSTTVRYQPPTAIDLPVARQVPPPGRLLTAEVLAQLFGVSLRTVWRYIEAGLLPQPARLSRKLVRWPSGRLAAWLASRDAA